MAYTMSEILNRKKRPDSMTGMAIPATRKAPPMTGTMAPGVERDRFRMARRIESSGRPAYPPNLVYNRPLSQFSPQSAAARMSATHGTDYGQELNRFTAPDPTALAFGARAPEFADTEMRKGRAELGGLRIANTAGRLANEGTAVRNRFIAPQLRQGLDVGQQQLSQATELQPHVVESARLENIGTGRGIEAMDIANAGQAERLRALPEQLKIEIQGLQAQADMATDGVARAQINQRIAEKNAELEQARTAAENTRFEQLTPGVVAQQGLQNQMGQQQVRGMEIENEYAPNRQTADLMRQQAEIDAARQSLTQGAEQFRYEMGKAPAFDAQALRRGDTEIETMDPKLDDRRRREDLAVQLYEQGYPVDLNAVFGGGAPAFPGPSGVNPAMYERSAGQAEAVMTASGLTGAIQAAEANLTDNSMRAVAKTLKNALQQASADPSGRVAQFIKQMMMSSELYQRVREYAYPPKLTAPLRVAHQIAAYPFSSRPKKADARAIVKLVEGK